MVLTTSNETANTRAAVLWPRPRAGRWRAGIEDASANPDQSDALLFLEEYGLDVAIEESTPFPWNPLARMHEMYGGLDAARSLRILGRLRQYDLILGVGDAVAFFLVQAKRLLRLRTPIVLIDPALSYTYPRRKRLQNWVLPYVQKIVVFSRSQVDYLTEQYGDRVDVVRIPHRIDTEFYCPSHATPAATEPGHCIVSVGGDASRDFETLVRAMELLWSWGRTDVRCVIKTHLPVREVPGVEVRRAPLSWVQLRELYRGASAVVLPLIDSLHPGGINTLLEAMAIGRPVVVSDSRGIRDYVLDGRTALLAEPETPEPLARGILRMIEDQGAANTMGKAAREWVVEHCDNRVYAQSLATILRDTAAAATAKRQRSGRSSAPRATQSTVSSADGRPFGSASQ